MKRFFKLSALTVFSIYLILQTNFFAISQISSEIQCTEAKVNYNYSRVLSVINVECDICELVKAQEMYNENGLLLGTLYSYSSGSEPVILDKIECQPTSVETDRCTQTSYTRDNSGCDDIFVPCTKEEDAECLETY